MTKNEFKVIVSLLKSNYTKFGIELKEQFEFWYAMFEEVDYQVAKLAVAKLCCENSYDHPKIADLRKAVAEVLTSKEDLLTGAEAWGEVMQAVKKFGNYRADEALESMSLVTRDLVKRIGFREICFSEELGVVRGQFLKMFEQIKNRYTKEKLLPQSLQKKINQLTTRDNTAINVRLYNPKEIMKYFEKT